MANPKRYASVVDTSKPGKKKRVRTKQTPKEPEAGVEVPAVVEVPERPWEDPNYVPPTIPRVEHAIPESDPDN